MTITTIETPASYCYNNAGESDTQRHVSKQMKKIKSPQGHLTENGSAS